MVFSSQLFLFYFLPIALAGYFFAPRPARHLVLTVLSYAFYGWANPAFMALMFLSTCIDYVCGLVIAEQIGAGRRDSIPLLDEGGPRSRRQRMAVTVSIISNLSLLGFFKYFNFAVDNLAGLGHLIGLPGLDLDLALRVTLPLGISFYTFQSMSYTIDVYRGHARAIRRFIDFACYVSMFPQLVAGPIIRFADVAEQLRNRTLTTEKFARGTSFFALGLAKKVLIANACGSIADLAFGAQGLGIVESWVGVIAYAFQIYFDFSGYSDMAIGLGLMLGFVFPKNFDSPYLSKSITEFWRRWHISLSSWLRDYLYVPLGGNRKGARRTYLNLAIVMLLGGLWHGAAWTFVVWGALHGGMLAFERAIGKDSLYRNLPPMLRTALTFVIVLVSWVFFRSDSLAQAVAYLGGMFGMVGPAPTAVLARALILRPASWLILAVAAVITWGAPQTWDYTRTLTVPKTLAIGGAFILAVVVLFTQEYNPFIYFIF